jgi:hypothetical protein
MSGNSDLKEALRAPGHCLRPEEVEAYLAGKKHEAESHVAGCAVCAHEIASFQEFHEAAERDEEKEDLDWIGHGQADRPAKPRRHSGWLSLWGAPRWAVSLALLLLIVAGGLQLRRMAGPPMDAVPDSGKAVVRSGQVQLQEPSGDLENRPAIFRWEAVPGADSYQIFLTEVDGTVLWTGTSKGADLTAPPVAQELMLPGKTLLWRVRAVDASGVVLGESGAMRFRVLGQGSR